MSALGRSHTVLAAMLSLTAMGLLVAALVRICGGIVTSDSVSYMAISHNLLAGDGFVLYDGRQGMTEWPPLYPLTLAAVQLVSALSAYHAGLLVNVLSYGALVFTALLHLRDCARSRLALAAGAFLIVASAPLLLTARQVIADTMFTATMMAGLLVLYRMHRDSNLSWRAVLLITVLCTAATMTRWLGFSLGLTVAFVLACTVWEKSRFSSPFLYARALPPVAVPFGFAFLWSFIDPVHGHGGAGTNMVADGIASVFTGPLPSSPATVLVEHVLFYVVDWFVPMSSFVEPQGWADVVEPAAALVIIAAWLVLVGCVATFGWAVYRGIMRTGHGVSLTFMLTYTAMLVIVAAAVWVSVIGTLPHTPRRVAPLYVPFLTVALVPLLDHVALQTPRALRNAFVRGLAGVPALTIMAAAVWGLYGLLVNPVFDDEPWIRYHWVRHGNSDFAVNLRTLLTDDEHAYSNYPPRVYHMWDQPGRSVFWVDPKRSFFSKQLSYQPQTAGDTLIWFYGGYSQHSRHSDFSVLAPQGLNLVYEDDVGAIYRFGGADRSPETSGTGK